MNQQNPNQRSSATGRGDDSASPGSWASSATAPNHDHHLKPSSAFANNTKQIIFPLRQWIKCSLESIDTPNNGNVRAAALSSEYLEACLKIAISLAEQVLEAEKLAAFGVAHNLDALSVGSDVDWASCALVRVSSCAAVDENEVQIGERTLLAGLATQSNNAAAVAAAAAQESENEMESFDWSIGAMVGAYEKDEEHVGQEVNVSAFNSFAPSPVTHRDVNDDNLNEELEAFLDRIGVNESRSQCETVNQSQSNDQSQLDGPIENELSLFDPSPAEVQDVNSQDLNEELETFMTRFGVNDKNEPGQLKASSAASPNAGYSDQVGTLNTKKQGSIDYLDIVSAEIQCPESSTSQRSIYHKESQEKLPRMYNLALLFHELFSGGETPPSELRTLASCNGAFVSIPTMTESDADESNQPKRRQGSSGSQKRVGLSIDHLNLMEVPVPLCNLVYNMLDCVYGDMSEEECYSNMFDVKSDLQLMLEKPKLLRGLDMDKLSSCLQLNEMSIPRDDEMQTILSCHRRCMGGSRELAIIKGESGSGKSWLSQRVGSMVIASGGIFIMGKFDIMQHAKPFSALSSALSQYCNIVIDSKGSEWAWMVVDTLRCTLGRDACYLIEIIPKLAELLGASTYETSLDYDKDCGNALQRIQYLLCRFVEVITNTSQVSITLCLDDVQWADEASISVLNRVLAHARNKLFFLACCRDDEIQCDNPFWNMLVDIGDVGVNVTTVKMGLIGQDTLINAMSDLLCLSSRVVKSLARIVFSKTQGSILFVLQMLHSFNRDGMLRIDLEKKRWVWDEGKIYSAELPDNVAIWITDGIGRLPAEVQLSIHALSMFGSSATSDCINALESELGVNISEPLKVAMEEGLVRYSNGSFSFSHDRIQAASYNMILEQDRICNHLAYGRCLIKHALETGDDDMLFTAINQINTGGASGITDRDEYFTMAQHNLTAGKRAMAKSNFHMAYSLFDHGVTFLRKDHWKKHYQFSLEIYELAARCALVSGHLQELRILTGQVLRQSKCFEDQLNAHFIIMSSKELSASQLPEALEKGLSIVRQLGEDISSNPTPQTFNQQLEFTIAITRDLAHDNNNIILNHA